MAQKLDRQTTTPFLLKLFYRSNGFHRIEDFTPTEQPSSHLQIYTWPTCSLRELTLLVTSALPSLLPDPASGTRLAFRLVYPDTRPSHSGRAFDSPGTFLAKDLGSVVVGRDMAIQNGDVDGNSARFSDGEAERTLQDAKFVIGDWVSCAVFPPLASGQVAPPPAPSSRPGYGGGRGSYGGGPRENGYGGAYRGGGRPEYGRGPPGASVPTGEWRRGERLPESSGGRGGYGRGRGHGW